MHQERSGYYTESAPDGIVTWTGIGTKPVGFSITYISFGMKRAPSPRVDFLPALINISGAEEKTEKDKYQTGALAGTKEGKEGVRDQVTPMSVHLSPLELGVSSLILVLSPTLDTPPTPESGKGPRHLLVLTALEAFQAVKDLLAIPVPLIPRDRKPLHVDQVLALLIMGSSREILQ